MNPLQVTTIMAECIPKSAAIREVRKGGYKSMLDFSKPDLARAAKPITPSNENAAGMKKTSGRPTVATPKPPVRPPRALLRALELMKIAEAVATAVGSKRCAMMIPSDAKMA